ncbi:uncharacterized protein LOC128163601 isoform X1 [Crassostrea angulata]|uniref:uncharacterized protein LOC128163601 isoform X1 n=1 Tax=Magallana angulata TaxID=2784310 RepID=UPI0022B1ED3C|nr:uncharacterized protein LOC128163601 isoform X1 [Crassostrea angulata]XP_052683187.1 uncharacterized protein LOC128163601 isoform X1 [Crassostrea angulata]
MGSSFFKTEYFMLAFCVRLNMNMSLVTIPVLSFLCLLCLVGHSQAQVNSEVAKDVDMNSLKPLLLTEIKRNIQSYFRRTHNDLIYEVRNFQLTDFVPPRTYLTLRRRFPPTYEWIGFNAQVYGRFDWFYDYRTWWVQQSNRGLASVAITRIGFSVYITRERGFITAGYCTSKRPSVAIRSRDSGLNWLDFYVIQLLENEIETLLTGPDGVICSYVRGFIERQGRAVSDMIDDNFGGIDITGGGIDITGGGIDITGGGIDITGGGKDITSGRDDSDDEFDD